MPFNIDIIQILKMLDMHEHLQGYNGEINVIGEMLTATLALIANLTVIHSTACLQILSHAGN